MTKDLIQIYSAVPSIRLNDKLIETIKMFTYAWERIDHEIVGKQLYIIHLKEVEGKKNLTYSMPEETIVEHIFKRCDQKERWEIDKNK